MIEVRDEFGDRDIHYGAAGFRTDEDTNNLEVRNAAGELVAAYAGGKWVSVVVRDG